VDVYATEPDFLASPLIKAPRLITTSHIGGFTQETMQRQALATVKAVKRALNGEIPHEEIHVINTDVLSHPGLRAKPQKA
jgi:phosphoglycerate dehydrogenase-like enzyme